MKYTAVVVALLSMLNLSSANNDECGNAESVVAGGTYSGSTSGKSFDNVGVCGTSNTAAGVWYTLVGDGSRFIASTCDNADYDTKISVFSGSCGALSCVGGNDDSCGLRSTVGWGTAPGHVYYILVHGFGSYEGTFDLSISLIPTPSNNMCGEAESVITGETYSGSTNYAGFDDVGFCGTSNTAAGVWYTLVGDGSPLRASTCNYASYDTKISVFTGSCGALSCVDGDDDDWSCPGSGLRSSVNWIAATGQVYYILVHGFGNGVGAFDLSVSTILLWSEEIPIGTYTTNGDDVCENAVNANLPGEYVGSTLTATVDDVPSCGYSSYLGVWYVIEGNGDFVHLSTCSYADYDTQISVFTGTCDGLVCKTYNDDTCGLQSAVGWYSVPGEVYYVLVHGFSSRVGNFHLEVTKTAEPEKPEFVCKTTGNEPNFLLGGYDVAVDGTNPSGTIMIDNLWQQNLLGQYSVEIYPFETFHLLSPSTSVGGDFAFDTHNGDWRGVGVEGLSTDTTEEISDDEGLYIYLGGLTVKEIIFGVRALFPDKITAPYGPEAGIVLAYFEGSLLDSRLFESYQIDPLINDDGQRAWRIVSSVEFDAVGFVTKSHNAVPYSTDGHDFFLEWIDLCCPPDASIKGDPHIQTWTGMKYDFHGVCDLVLLKNPDFQAGLGMDIHVRTKQLKQFSYVSSAVLRIGSETLEVMGHVHENIYWLNKQLNASLNDGINGYPISYRKVNSKQHEFVVDLGNNKSIVLKTFKKFVRVNFVGATKEIFGASSGLLGSYGSGKMLGRDNVMEFEDMNAFGQEWQVLPSEEMLFHNADGPQAPAKCEIPMASSLRRRLAESAITEEEAGIACGHVNREDFDVCVFDVMATGDMDVVGAY